MKPIVELCKVCGVNRATHELAQHGEVLGRFCRPCALAALREDQRKVA